MNNIDYDFWGNKIDDFNNPIVFIYNTKHAKISEWPTRQPEFYEALNDLQKSGSCFISISKFENSIKENFSVKIIYGLYLIQGVINNNEGKPLRLYLSNNGIKFASPKKKANIIKYGFRLRHKGILLVTGDNYRTRFENKNFWNSSDYCLSLIKLAESHNARKGNINESDNVGEETDEAEEISESETHYLENVSQFVEAEYEVEKNAASSIPPFSYVKVKPTPHITSLKQYFSFELGESDFKRIKEIKPSFLRIELKGVKDNNEDISIEVYEITNKNNIFELIGIIDRQISLEEIPPNGNLYLSALPTLKNVRLSVLDSLKKNLSANKWISKVISNQYSYIPLKNIMDYKNDNVLIKMGLNPSQAKAVINGINTPDYSLVLGPPGTGKTTVIAQWVKFFSDYGMRVLVSSQNNKAVDNVLARLKKDKSIECVRIGNEAKISEDVKDLLIDNYAVNIQEKISNQVQISIDEITNVINYLKKISEVLPDYLKCQKEFSELNNSISNLKIKIDKIKNKLENYYVEIKNFSSKKLENNKKIIENNDKISNLKEKNIEENLFKKTFGFFNKAFLSAKKTYYQFNEKNYVKKLEKYDKAKSFNEKYLEDQNKIKFDLEKRIQDITNKLHNYNEIKYPIHLESLNLYKFPSDISGNIEEDILLIKGQIDNYLMVYEIIKGWKNELQNIRQQSMYNMLLSLVDVVGATCIGINTTKSFSNVNFDVTIVDESGQIQIQNVIVPLSRAPKAILVGDHKQLPPVIDNALKDEVVSRIGDDDKYTIDLLEKSFFEVLWNNSPESRKVMLDTQFRCPKIVADFISEAFYENKYFSHESTSKRKPFKDLYKSSLIFFDTSNVPGNIKYESSSKGEDDMLSVTGNKLETKIILYIIKMIQDANADDDEFDLGIISPYKNHVNEIKKAIKAEINKNNIKQIKELDDIVATVDSFQGQERDIIIFSFVRSNERNAIGFLKDWRRLNVAMTRVKQQLFMVGDINMLSSVKQNKYKIDPMEVKFRESMNFLKEFCKKQNMLIDVNDILNNIK
ncbi:MAG: hypothetical protein EVJ48_04710 [Candidatus Acidulodesulfobacterium acidiphilum]|jgi:superfamily I DNA and/or RNA helicase|uniref:AAA+ ATPase domain-containing protein n=1 Tax=Candidatus Acidulodesulfobacterium acidiphilum TaxID=2597224 RepID=A0A520XE70_9DELT|nr:MAG: hypothetical protein EVJ48_04710 [Candidatus Acidulodesulfobacterium acidiphilum]